MSLNMNEKRRLLESIEFIDDAVISDTMSRVRTDAVTAGMPSGGKKHVIWVKQIAVLAACVLILGAIIPVISFVSKSTDLFSGFGAGADPEVDATDPLPEATEALVETEPEEIIPDEHGTPGLRYMVNEDGVTASFIGWGDCTAAKAYIASVYEGLPVTKIIFIEHIEQQERLKEIELTDPNYIEATITADDFSYPEIRHIIIPDSIEYVHSQVILQCTNLESLHIGAGVTEIVGSFYYNGDRGRNFSRITVSPENEVYTEKGNCLIKIKDKALLCGFADSVIPTDGSVEIIGNVAFYNKPGLTSLVIPEGITRIYSCAFTSNDGLVSVSLPSTIKTIFASFASTSGLTELKYAGTVEQWLAVSENWSGWISNSALTQVTCTDGVVELKYNGWGELVE